MAKVAIAADAGGFANLAHLRTAAPAFVLMVETLMSRS
jgi:hypothetical protein